MLTRTLSVSNSVRNHAGFSPVSDDVQLVASHAAKALIIKGLPLLINKDGEEVQGTILQANKRVKLVLGQVHSPKHLILVSTNPDLLENAQVSSIGVIEPGESIVLTLFLTTSKQIELQELDYLVKLYCLADK